MARLAGHVSLRDAVGNVVQFGPGDEVPEWAAKRITNPRLWEDGEVPFPPAEPEGPGPVAEQTDEALRAEVEKLRVENQQLRDDKQQLVDEVTRLQAEAGGSAGSGNAPEPPPRGGAGANLAAWSEYASHFADKVTITEDDKRDDIIDKLEKAGVRVE
ncbi:MAG: hypothetical protein PGN30_10200 [Mycolicibacterium neoaurum]|uniref:hypothetical protein n=1 Tax=Mycolicibacterium neoaurum TaxID=1795 RepID=UPI002FFB56EC